MKNIFTFAIILISAGCVCCGEGLEAIYSIAGKEASQNLIRDGFALPNNGVEGKIKKASGNDKWVFSPYTDISDGKGVIKSGETIELLPSSTLEKLTALVTSEDPKNKSAEVKLWGIVTKYNNHYSSRKLYYGVSSPTDKIITKNFLFATNFVPITSIKEPKTEIKPPAASETEDDRSIIPESARDLFSEEAKSEETKDEDGGKNNNSIIPKEVMEKFKLKRVENLAKWKKSKDVETDAMISARTGFITSHQGSKIFALDALGRNKGDNSFILLPCQILEMTELNLVTDPGRQRYKISGTITRFKDKYYILPQRLVKTYDHGNFGR